MPTKIIAEMACSHDGQLPLAQKIVAGAGAAGADAIQFQIWLAKDIMVPHHPSFPTLERIELSRQDWRLLVEQVRKDHPTMQIIACVYEHESVAFSEEIQVDAYKLHSSDLSNPSLVKRVAATGKRIDLSVGASTLTEIQTAIEWIKQESSSEIWLMYGYQSFPTPTDGINLNYMMKLKNLFELPVGYQDHSDADTDAAFWLPAAAVGMGVEVIEKHITHDRSCKGVDHEAALNPDEFSRFVKMIREIEVAKGTALPRPFSPAELDYRIYSKKSLVAACDLKAGTLLEDVHLVPMRAEELGLPPDRADELTGKKLSHDIKAFHLVRKEDLL